MDRAVIYLKHFRHHNWLVEHKDQLLKFVDQPGDYKIISFVLSSNVIPVVYLAKNKAALPIISFRDTVVNGFTAVVEKIDIHLNFLRKYCFTTNFKLIRNRKS